MASTISPGGRPAWDSSVLYPWTISARGQANGSQGLARLEGEGVGGMDSNITRRVR